MYTDKWLETKSVSTYHIRDGSWYGWKWERCIGCIENKNGDRIIDLGVAICHIL